MPELPDVEIFRRLVECHCRGRIVAQLTVPDPGSLEGASVRSLRTRVMGKVLRSCRRHGKYLFIEFDHTVTLAMHFGTNGALRFVSDGQSEPPYVRLSLELVDGNSLAYINPRRIGRVRLVESTDAFIAEARLGPDVLAPSFEAAAFAALLVSRRQPIKAVLMDQTRMAGIGNIYADEILFQDRLHPRRIAATLSVAESHHLFEVIREVLQTAIECGAGAEEFIDRLPKGFLLPQRRVGGHCPRCGTILQTERRGGRTGYFCPRCQPEPGR